MASFGLKQWIAPSHPPFSGRIAWLLTYVVEQWGLRGPAILSLVVACLLLVLGLFGWIQAVKQRRLDIRPVDVK